MKAGFIREAKYPKWISNVVLVKKANEKWRMCVDFTDLNKACPKDSFPVLKIYQLVDSTAGHNLLSFMDAFSDTTRYPWTSRMRKAPPLDEYHLQIRDPLCHHYRQ